MERARYKYTTEKLAAWAMKPFWGLLKLLQRPIQAAILLLMHAFRLGLTLGNEEKSEGERSREKKNYERTAPAANLLPVSNSQRGSSVSFFFAIEKK